MQYSTSVGAQRSQTVVVVAPLQSRVQANVPLCERRLQCVHSRKLVIDLNVAFAVDDLLEDSVNLQLVVQALGVHHDDNNQCETNCYCVHNNARLPCLCRSP